MVVKKYYKFRKVSITECRIMTQWGFWGSFLNSEKEKEIFTQGKIRTGNRLVVFSFDLPGGFFTHLRQLGKCISAIMAMNLS